ncbi:MAG: hypothetical protein JJO71_37435 [Escherichia coli]|uniref:hypothetical protein n=1 Tax=Escherichia coli TaxID=562 RepID=UPI000D170B48|nr:hypothetical protein [Escherichia coli]EGF7425547.1 hypothetical protein [Escherichia coli]MBK1764784.1 hypothetical protein [Escherichia coli]MBL1009307.1 hypothetical protein [Escherichia coli]PSY66844.1 hypothetical protein C7B18_22205 [Escherichia coli]CAD5882596.1 Uncharacterised protein [Escherichia coli]
MELTADLLKSLNNIRQNATIYVHAYHYTDDEKCVIPVQNYLRLHQWHSSGFSYIMAFSSLETDAYSLYFLE